MCSLRSREYNNSNNNTDNNNNNKTLIHKEKRKAVGRMIFRYYVELENSSYFWIPIYQKN